MRLSLNLNNAINLKAKAPLLLHSLCISTSADLTLAFRSVSTPSKPVPLTLSLTRTTTASLPSPFTRCGATMATAAGVQVKDHIELTEIEEKIFGRLLDTCRHFDLKTQLRVAGGWVRDKLLGKACYDIDIALENMLGSEFAEKVQEYLSSTGEELQGRTAIIKSNPEQSKHLETAKMRLFDLWIDFVNLRCEDYCENSRIPMMKFGTAEDDAYRRDLTINSLFYNISTKSVEDFTKRGIDDLKFGRIVTPSPPKATFLDDPLRVLRAIRFGARFGFTLDEELKKAASSDEVKKALAQKVTRERIGTEIDLMISGNQPAKAIDHICDLTLFWVVFDHHEKIEPAVSDSEECYRLSAAYLDATWKLIQLIGYSSFDGEQRRLCLYSALFLPLCSATYKDEKAKKMPAVKHIFNNSLKLKSSDAETVINVLKSLDKFLSLIPALLSNGDIQLMEVEWGREFVDVPVTSKLRVLTGLLLREIQDYWRVALLVSTLLYPTDIDFSQDILDKNFQLEKRTDLFVSVENAIVKLGQTAKVFFNVIQGTEGVVFRKKMFSVKVFSIISLFL
ncbi:hypothetical protein PTKIN_Ptkin09bG0076700 [Pterospermum kingtungense]